MDLKAATSQRQLATYTHLLSVVGLDHLQHSPFAGSTPGSPEELGSRATALCPKRTVLDGLDPRLKQHGGQDNSRPEVPRAARG